MHEWQRRARPAFRHVVVQGIFGVLKEWAGRVTEIACQTTLQCLRAGFLAGPAEDDSGAHRSRTDRSFTLDVYGHTLDWRENKEAAQKLGDSSSEGCC